MAIIEGKSTRRQSHCTRGTRRRTARSRSRRRARWKAHGSTHCACGVEFNVSSPLPDEAYRKRFDVKFSSSSSSHPRQITLHRGSQNIGRMSALIRSARPTASSPDSSASFLSVSRCAVALGPAKKGPSTHN